MIFSDLDINWQKTYQQGKPEASNELAQYEQYLRRELPPAVRRELEIAVKKEFSPLEERLKSQLINIVRDLQLQLFQSYTQSRRVVASDAPVLDPTSAMTAAGRSENRMSDPPQTVIPEYQDTTLENQLAPYQPAPPLENSTNVDFDAVLFQFDDLSGFEDSAYGSLFAETMFPKSGWQDGSRFCYNPNDNGEGPSCG